MVMFKSIIQKAKSSEQFSLWGLVITFLIIIIAFIFIDMGELKDSVVQAGVWAPVIFILLKISTIVFAPLSGSPLYLVVGVLFGFWNGWLYVLIGDFLGYTIAFGISRIFGYNLVNKFISTREHGLISKIIRHIGSTKGLFQICLTCIPVPELISYAAGLSRISYLKFISILWPIAGAASLVLVLLGAKLGDTQNFFTLNIIVLILVAIVVFIGASTFTKSFMSHK